MKTIELMRKENTKNVLTPRQQSLVAIASFEAKGDIRNLETALNKAFDKGLTLNELKEIFCHLYSYTGFPRALNGLSALQRVLADRLAKGLTCEEGRMASPLPYDFDALKEGTKVQTSLFGNDDYPFVPAMDYYLKAHLFGDVFANDLLEHKERELLTISALASINGLEIQLTGHLEGAQNKGMTKEEMYSYVQTLTDLGDEETAQRARKAVAEHFNGPNDK